MLPPADYFRLDWRPEIKKLGPYLKGKSGVVRINLASDEAAADKFNYILKEDFGKPGNGCWLSLRVDKDWSTTYTDDDQIVAFANKLGEVGVKVDWPRTQMGDASYFSNNQSGDDMSITVTNSTFVNGFDTSTYAVRARVKAICDAMQRYVADGGHFMINVNDMATAHQGRFWKLFWNAGLREAGGGNLLLVYYVGPLCGHAPHTDAPAPDLQLRLPIAIEGDESRECDVYDDVFDIFTKLGYDNKEASMAANGLLAAHAHSVIAMQTGLAKLIMRTKQKNSGFEK